MTQQEWLNLHRRSQDSLEITALEVEKMRGEGWKELRERRGTLFRMVVRPLVWDGHHAVVNISIREMLCTRNCTLATILTEYHLEILPKGIGDRDKRSRASNR